MPRHVRDARIETREARSKLAVQSEPYWRAIVQGAHVGYYKGARRGDNGAHRGAWLVRWRKSQGGYRKATLGETDDIRDANGVNVLDYRQAQQKALAQIAAWERGGVAGEQEDGAERVPGTYTVAEAMEDHIAWLSKHRKPTAALMPGRPSELTSIPNWGSSPRPS